MASNILVQIRFIVLNIYLPIVAIGFLSNMLAFVVFSRKKFEKNTIFTIYFRFLTAFDTLSLLLPLNKYLEYVYNIYISKISDFFCIFRFYILNVISSISGWITVFISLDRLISITSPSRYLIRKNPLFQITICLLIVFISSALFSLNINSHIFVSYKNATNKTLITINCLAANYPIFSIIRLIYSDSLPFLIMIISTCLTLKQLFKSRKRAKSNNTNTDSTIKQKDRKFAITSIAVNIIFLTLNTPYCLTNTIYQFWPNLFDIDIYNFLVSIFQLIYFSNFASIFWVNFFVNSLFKQELYELLLNKSRQ